MDFKKKELIFLLKKKIHLIVIILLLILFIQSVSSITNKTITNDEFGFLPRGYIFLKTGDLSITGHPPFAQIWASLPLLFMKLNIDKNYKSYIINNNYLGLSDKFFYEWNNNIDQMVFWARFQIILLSLLLAFFVYKWVKELYGKKAALFALLLYTFSPNILAHSTLFTTDFPFTCFMFISAYYLWKFSKKKTGLYLFASSFFFGLAQVSKFTAIFLIPIFFILILILAIKEKKVKFYAYSLIAILLIGLLVINITYVFKGSFTPLGRSLDKDPAQYFDKNIFNSASIAKKAPTFIRPTVKYALDHVPLFVPYPYIKDFVVVIKQGLTKEFAGGFLIVHHEHGLWYYFLIVFLLKVPTALIILLILSIILFSKIKNKDSLDELFIIIPILIIFTYFSLHNINEGLRYILPVWPFIFVFVSKLSRTKNKFLNIALLILIFWYLFSSLSIYPHYLSYFNEFIGSENGYKYLIGSNLDWGQDLKNLKIYMDKNNIEKVKLAYFGRARPDYYKINYDKLAFLGAGKINQPDYSEYCLPTNGTIAISATFLQGLFLDNKDCFNWLKVYKPTDNVGYSILIYNIK